MSDTENSEQILDDFEDFLVDWPRPEEIDMEIEDIHLEAHSAEDMGGCRSCDELYEMADEA